MLVIGLTGGIGAGKSEVAQLLEELGARVINADKVGHEAYRPGSDSWRQVVQAFGEGILQATGEIDRGKLGAIVFSDPGQLARLNGILHPTMAGIVADGLERLRSDGVRVAVVEAALLLEAGWDSLVDEVWTTDAPVEAVMGRLKERNGMSGEEVQKRIDSQMDRAERLARSHVVVDNSGSVAELRSAVGAIWETRVKGRFAENNG
jgi:dephospho-CoA kinase